MNDETNQTLNNTDPTSPEVYLHLDFGEKGGSLNLNSFSDLIEFCHQLKSDWQWFLDGPFTTFVQSARDDLNTALFRNPNYNLFVHSQPQNIFDFKGDRTSIPAEYQESIKSAVQQKLQPFLKTHSWLLPDQSYRNYIFTLKEQGRTSEAALIVAYLLRDLLGLNSSEQIMMKYIDFQNLLDFEMFAKGLKGRSEIETQKLDILHGTTTTLLTQIRDQKHSQQVEWLKMQEQIKDDQAANQKIFDQKLEEFEKTKIKFLANFENQKTAIEDKYNKAMQLNAPVGYWIAKRLKHTYAYIGLALILLVLLGLSTFVAWDILPGYIDGLLDASSKSWNLTFFKISPYILLVTLYLWFFRLMVRAFLSNLHLASDASERIAMTQTYLALLENDSNDIQKSLITEKHLDIVLSALFRPTGDGIVKDEALPANLNILNKLTSKD